MFDVSKLEIESIANSYNPHEFAIYYIYSGGYVGLTYVDANDELGAYQGLLKQLEERYENG
jgi:hypothetical protein